MQILALTLAAMFFVSSASTPQAKRTPEFWPMIKEVNGIAYVDPDTRLRYIERAAIWQPVNLDEVDVRAGRQIADSSGSSKILPNDSIVECQYSQDTLGGTTDKFHCDFLKATDANHNPIDIKLKKLKVRYNSVKIYTDVIVTRLAWILGFGAEVETPVLKVICHGCSRDPFHQKGPVAGVQTFDRASIETRFPSGDGIYSEDIRFPKDQHEDVPAWYWKELKYIIDPERKAQGDALELLAVFLKHGDSKAIQNSLVCLTAFDANGVCNDPFLYVKDFGNTLGSDGMSVHPLDLKKWSAAKLWSNSERCIGSLQMNMGNGSGLSDPEISEAGRLFLAGLLTDLIRHESKLHDIFEASNIQDYDDHGHRYSADDWVQAFKARAELITNHPPCPK